jgi:hypothetical protein
MTICDQNKCDELFLELAPFPWDKVRSMSGPSIAERLRVYERADCHPPHHSFVNALNTALVWVGARTAALPPWSRGNQILELISFFNKIGQQLRDGGCACCSVSELTFLQRPQLYRAGTIVQQGVIVRRNNHRVRFTSVPPVNDSEIGRNLDMYPPNTDHFADGLHEKADMAFSIWEAGTDALVYAETWKENLLSPEQRTEFLGYCEKKVELWNTAMERLGLVYRFYGTMDWKRTEVPWEMAERTQKYFGKAFIGCDSRPTDVQGNSSQGGRHSVSLQKPNRRSLVAAA